LYPAVGFSSAGEEVRLIGAAQLWGMDAETEAGTQNNTVEEVCVPVILHRTFYLSFMKEGVKHCIFIGCKT